MKRWLLFLVFGLWFVVTPAQTHFITAGQTQGMIFTDYIPNYHGTKDIDINRDLIDDFKIYYYSSSGLPGGSSTVAITCLNGNGIYTKLDTKHCFYVGGYPCQSDTILVAKKFLTGDTLYYSNDTFWRGYAKIQTTAWIAGTSSIETDYQVPTDTPYYYFVKLLVNSDTLLGYIHFSTNLDGILDYACEGPTSSYIINSVNDLSLSNFSLSPNPASTQLNITVDEALIGAQLNIYDVTGALVQSTVLQIQNSKLQIQNLPPGVYIAEVKAARATVTRRWVKM